MLRVSTAYSYSADSTGAFVSQIGWLGLSVFMMGVPPYPPAGEYFEKFYFWYIFFFGVPCIFVEFRGGLVDIWNLLVSVGIHESNNL